MTMMKRTRREAAKALLIWTLLVAGAVGAGAGGDRVAVEVAVSREIVEAANALLASVADDAERGRLLLAFDDPARRDWSYWPRRRVGLRVGDMTGEQRVLTYELLGSILSSGGYLKVVQIMQLERVLAELEGNDARRNLDHYVAVLFGRPSASEPWSLRFEGHHVSLNVAVVPEGGVRVTPSFLGANPAAIVDGPLAGVRPLRYEEHLGRALVRSLDDVQRSIAVIPGRLPGDVLSGTIGKDADERDRWRDTLRPEGIRVASLSTTQRGIARRLLDQVLATYRPEIASAAAAGIDLDELSFAWIGSVEPGQPHYYRLQGADFVFEFDVVGRGNHVHTVWRDKSGDFGADLLRAHYEHDH